ncbi:MAG TPA: hypothetical protein DEA91_10875, partial [Paenibacillus sp.]|nr:hypothetical protein [Paenibacillus sp.]
ERMALKLVVSDSAENLITSRAIFFREALRSIVIALVDGRFGSYADTQMRGHKCIYEEYHYRSASAFRGLFIGIRPRTLSANAYDDC